MVSTEFLPRGGGETIILVISNRRFMCVRAHLPGHGNAESDPSGGSGGGVRVAGGVHGNGGRGSGGAGARLRGSGITAVELEWQVMLESLTGLPALVEEDGSRTILDFTHVTGAPASTTNRRREVISGFRHNKERIAGLVSVFGGGEGFGTSSISNSNVAGGPGSNVAGFGGVGISNYAGTGGHEGGGKGVRTRRVEGLYRDRPALVRAYNVVACLTHRIGRLILTPGGVNVSGSKIIARSHFPPVGVEGGPQLGMNNRDGMRPGFLGVLSINGWEFGEDPRDRLSLTGQATARCYSFDGSYSGLLHGSAFPGSGSPREGEDRLGRAVAFGHPAAARRSERFAVRSDQLAPADLWMSLRLPVRQRNSVPAEKLRPIPQAFEMDAVVWRPGPIAPRSDLGSGWLIAARVSALEAPNELIRWVFDYVDSLNYALQQSVTVPRIQSVITLSILVLKWFGETQIVLRAQVSVDECKTS